MKGRTAIKFTNPTLRFLKPLSSLHQAAATGEEVMDVCDHSFGQVGHGAVAAAGGAVVEEVADSCGRIFLQEKLIGPARFLKKECSGLPISQC